MGRFQWKLPALAIAMLLSGVQAVTASENAALEGSEWGYPGRDRPFVRFETEKRLVGNGGCNNFFGTWFVHDGDKLSIGPLAGTRMACTPEIMQQEAEFMGGLEAASGFRIVEGKLTIYVDGLPWTEMERRDWD